MIYGTHGFRVENPNTLFEDTTRLTRRGPLTERRNKWRNMPCFLQILRDLRRRNLFTEFLVPAPAIALASSRMFSFSVFYKLVGGCFPRHVPHSISLLRKALLEMHEIAFEKPTDGRV